MDEIRGRAANRIADMVLSETGAARAAFATAVARMLQDNPRASMDWILGQAALQFPTRAEAELFAEEAPSAAPEAESAAPAPQPVDWPLLVRQPRLAVADPETGTELALPASYALADDPADLYPRVLDEKPYAMIDWLTPGVDDVVVVISLFASETERDAYMDGWLQGCGRSDDRSPGAGAGCGDAVAQEVDEGFVCVAWKPDPRNLIVWRDARTPLSGRILAVSRPDASVHGWREIEDAIATEFA